VLDGCSSVLLEIKRHQIQHRKKLRGLPSPELVLWLFPRKLSAPWDDKEDPHAVQVQQAVHRVTAEPESAVLHEEAWPGSAHPRAKGKPHAVVLAGHSNVRGERGQHTAKHAVWDTRKPVAVLPERLRKLVARADLRAEWMWLRG